LCLSLGARASGLIEDEVGALEQRPNPTWHLAGPSQRGIHLGLGASHRRTDDPWLSVDEQGSGNGPVSSKEALSRKLAPGLVHALHLAMDGLEEAHAQLVPALPDLQHHDRLHGVPALLDRRGPALNMAATEPTRKRRRWGDAEEPASATTPATGVPANPSLPAGLQEAIARLNNRATAGIASLGSVPVRVLKRVVVWGLPETVEDATLKTFFVQHLALPPTSAVAIERGQEMGGIVAEFDRPDLATSAMALTGARIGGATIRVARPREYEEALNSRALAAMGAASMAKKREKVVPTVLGITGGDPSSASAAMVQCIQSALGFTVPEPHAPVLPSGLPPNLDSIPRLLPRGPELRLGPSKVLVILNCMSDEDMYDPDTVADIADEIVQEAQRILDEEVEATNLDQSTKRPRGFGTGSIVSHKAPHKGPSVAPVPPPPSPGVPGQITSSLVAKVEQDKPAGESSSSAIISLARPSIIPGAEQPVDLVKTIMGAPLVSQRWPHPDVPGAGRVFIETDSPDTALRLADGLAGRSFNGKILVASFLGERAYQSDHFWGWGYAYGEGAEGKHEALPTPASAPLPGPAVPDGEASTDDEVAGPALEVAGGVLLDDVM
jgi:hypothetical protein